LLAVGDPNSDSLAFQTSTVPTHGLILNFNSSAGSVTYQPVHGYRGADRFTWSANDGLLATAVASMNLTVVAPADTNGNNLPDAWETRFGVNDPNADPDGDQKNNLEEFIADTNPTNRASVIKIISETRATNGFTTVTWASVGGVRYRVQYSDGGNNSGFTGSFTDIVRSLEDEMDSAPAGVASARSFIDDFTLTGGAPASKSRYYRIKIVQ
jgi:hypothetical protein